MTSRAGICGCVCECCDQPTAYADSVPDATIPGIHPSECGYRLMPLCRLHAYERRQVATSRLHDVILTDDGVAHLDGGWASGECLCADCGQLYWRHPANASYPFLYELCDGTLVKL